jgi:hypothetical protein
MPSLMFSAGRALTEIGAWRPLKSPLPRFSLAFTLFLVSSGVFTSVLLNAKAELRGADLVFGQLYGSAVFVEGDPATVSDAADVVLAFEFEGHKNLVLAQKNGDFLALLEPGRYCLLAYTRQGQPLQLDEKQVKCVNVEPGRDSRLDVVLHSREK